VLIVLVGMVRPLDRLIAAIPAPIAGAMLAGVLLPLCLAPVRAVAEVPLLAVPVVVVWAVVLRFARQWAVPAALAAAAVGIVLTGPGLGGADLTPALVWTAPRFDPATLVGVGLPLFLVTMASQNVPGMAVLVTYGYRPRLGPILGATGLGTVGAAALILLSPPVLVSAVAGLALLGALAAALASAVSDPAAREAAAVTSW
jgi:benzoate membrane transport protein